MKDVRRNNYNRPIFYQPMNLVRPAQFVYKESTVETLHFRQAPNSHSSSTFFNINNNFATPKTSCFGATFPYVVSASHVESNLNLNKPRKLSRETFFLLLRVFFVVVVIVSVPSFPGTIYIYILYLYFSGWPRSFQRIRTATEVKPKKTLPDLHNSCPNESGMNSYLDRYGWENGMNMMWMVAINAKGHSLPHPSPPPPLVNWGGGDNGRRQWRFADCC